MQERTGGGVAIYHDMRVHESFEQCAQRLFTMVRDAQRTHPGRPRYLFLDVQGHRNSAGGFDHDAYEVLGEFVLGFLMQYLTEVHTPLIDVMNGKQNNSVPDSLEITDSFPDERQVPRDEDPDPRRSVPTVRAIADYLGLDEDPGCMICWSRPVERAHARPVALGGSNDVRNFALLCAKHHQLAPDVKDSNSFWRWMDWMLDIDGPFSRLRPGYPDKPEPDFFGDVRRQLCEVYGWQEEELEAFTWTEVFEAQYRILSQDTSKHFGIDRKASTHAWAINQALQELTAGQPDRRVARDGDQKSSSVIE